MGLWTVAGLLALGAGYTVAVRAETDSMILFNFFLAVFLVITGTYFLFTSGSMAFLRLMRGNRRIYYQPSNFITISGMYYRMKKSAAGLSNICIFSTMVIITLTCTITLYAGIDEITHYDYPYDIKASYDGSGISSAQVEEKAAELAEKSYHLVLANIVADVIIPLSAKAGEFMTPDGVFLTSGVIDGREDEVRAALEGAEVLVQRDKEVQLAVNEFGKGRAVYISGLPYSFENSRLLHRAVLWSAHSEDQLNLWLSSNCNVDVHAYVKNGKFCVVNNTYEPQSTTVYRGDGSSFPLDLAANEIRWYEI